MNKAKVMDAFYDDDRFDGDKIWRKVFQAMDPEEGYDILEKLFGAEEVNQFPKDMKIEFDKDVFDNFTDELAEKISQFESVEEASKDLEFDIDLGNLEKLEATVNEIKDRKTVESNNVYLIKDVYELTDAIDNNEDWSKEIKANRKFRDIMEELNDFAKTWEIE